MSANRYDARMLSPQAKEALRRRVVHAVVEQGMRPTQALRVFRVSRTTVYDWVRAYRAGGAKAQQNRPLGRRKNPRLSDRQEVRAVKLIAGRCPDQLKLPFALWTQHAVCRLLGERFGLRVSLWTAKRYLRRWGLTPQKPVRRAYERDPIAVQRWLREEYTAIRAKANQEKAEIHWGDEMCLCSGDKGERSYGKRGYISLIQGMGHCFVYNMISTIDNRKTLHFMVFQDRLTQPLLLTFLRRLVRSVKRKVFLFVEGHPVYQGEMVQRWLAAHQDRIALRFLPGRSRTKIGRVAKSGQQVAHWPPSFQGPSRGDGIAARSSA